MISKLVMHPLLVRALVSHPSHLPWHRRSLVRHSSLVSTLARHSHTWGVVSTTSLHGLHATLLPANATSVGLGSYRAQGAPSIACHVPQTGQSTGQSSHTWQVFTMAMGVVHTAPLIGQHSVLSLPAW